MKELTIEYFPVSELKPYKRNARKHAQEDVEAIAASIREFGFSDPIGVWGKNNLIVEGHGRLLAAQQLGMDTVPVIHLDHLSDEQRRAYALAHNRTAELSAWDLDTMFDEIDKIANIDMSAFGFDELEEEADDTEEPDYQEETQDRVERILNLDQGFFPGEGKYDIPALQPVTKLGKIKEWIGFNYVLSDDNPKEKAVHFFVDDYQFERLLRNPMKYVDKLREYECVATPDFSPYGDMPLACQIFNHYRKHWIGAFLQKYGVTVIPTIRSSTDPRSLEWYLDGEPHNGIVLISSMWGDMYPEEAKTEYDTMIERLNPCKVIVYGSKKSYISERESIEYIPSFAQKRFAKQGDLLNAKGEARR